MEEAEALRIYRDAGDELVQARETMRAASNEMEALRQIRLGLLGLFPDLTDNDDPVGTAEDDSWTSSGPKGASAVGVVLAETPGKWFSVPMVVKELERRGWLTDSENPSNATRAALERLLASDEHVRKDRGEKTGKVVYSYRASDGERPVREDASG